MPPPISGVIQYLIPASVRNPTDNRQGCIGTKEGRRRWQTGQTGGPQTRAPFTLLRFKPGAYARRVQKHRERIAEKTDRICSALRRTSDPDKALQAVQEDLTELQHSQAVLEQLTHADSPMRDVLQEQTIKRYLPNAGIKQINRRNKDLLKLQQSPLFQLRTESPQLEHIWNAVEREKALEASACEVQSLCRAYENDDGILTLTPALMGDLIALCNAMKTLCRDDFPPGQFLYPAVKLMYERGRLNGPVGENDLVLLNMLKDLSSNRLDNWESIRAQLDWDEHNWKLKAYQSGRQTATAEQPETSAQSREGPELLSPDRKAMIDDMDRKAMINDMDMLLDGLEDAARQVLKEELLTRAPGWASTLQDGLFREAQFLYGSIQNWERKGLKRTSDDPILQYAPAKAVDVLIGEAIQRALGTPDESALGTPGESADKQNNPGKNWDSLLSNMTRPFSHVAEHIDKTLDLYQVTSHTSPQAIQKLRQELMREVVAKTGIWKEVARLDPSGEFETAGREALPDAVTTGRPVIYRIASSIRRGIERLFTSSTPPSSQAAESTLTAVHPAFWTTDIKNAPASRKADFKEAAPLVHKAVKQAERDSHYHVTQLLHLFQKGDADRVRAYFSKHGETLAQARRTLTLRGNATGTSWKKQLEKIIDSGGDAFTYLSTGLLRSYIIDAKPGSLVGHLEPRDLFDSMDEMLSEIWGALKTITSKRELTSPLRQWCDVLNKGHDAINDKALFAKFDELRIKVTLVSRDTVAFTKRGLEGNLYGNVETFGPAALLRIAMQDLSDAELRALTTSERPHESNNDLARRLSRMVEATHKDNDSAASGTNKALEKNESLLDIQTVIEKENAEIDSIRKALQTAAHEEARARLEAHRTMLTQQRGPDLLKEAGRLYSLLDHPEAQKINGPASTEVKKLIDYAIRQVALKRQQGEVVASTLMRRSNGTRFVRTSVNYQAESMLAAQMRNLVADLRAGLDEKMRALNYPSPTQRADEENQFANEILENAGVWKALATVAAKETDTGNTVTGEQADTGNRVLTGIPEARASSVQIRTPVHGTSHDLGSRSLPPGISLHRRQTETPVDGTPPHPASVTLPGSMSLPPLPSGPLPEPPASITYMNDVAVPPVKGEDDMYESADQAISDPMPKEVQAPNAATNPEYARMKDYELAISGNVSNGTSVYRKADNRKETTLDTESYMPSNAAPSAPTIRRDSDGQTSSSGYASKNGNENPTSYSDASTQPVDSSDDMYGIPLVRGTSTLGSKNRQSLTKSFRERPRGAGKAGVRA